MQLPQLVDRFVTTHNNYDSKAFVECFTTSAIVHDEGKTHKGKEEIRKWIEHSNEEYRSVMKPLKYEESGATGVLTAAVSGTFPGSPVVLKFHLTMKNDLIDELNATD